MPPPNRNWVLVHGNPEFPLFSSERRFTPGHKGIIATCPYCGIQWGRMGFSEEPAIRRYFLAGIPCTAHGIPFAPGGSFLLILPLFRIDLNLLSRPFLEYETRLKIDRILNPQQKTHQ